MSCYLCDLQGPPLLLALINKVCEAGAGAEYIYMGNVSRVSSHLWALIGAKGGVCDS